VSLIGIKTVALAVNKMDLVGYEEAVFRRIEGEYRQFAESLGIGHVTAIPLSALRGDNVVTRSTLMPWYGGASLLAFLEDVPIDRAGSEGPFRMPVQWVNRPSQSFRGFSGLIAGGSVRSGDRVRVMPGGRETAVERIVTFDGDVERAVAGQSVTLTFNDEVDASRGTVIAAAKDPLPVADQFETSILWMGDEPMLPGRHYLVKMRHPNGPGSGGAAEIQDQRQHAGTHGGAHARAQRDRGVQSGTRCRDRLRSLWREPRPWRLHPDRPLQQQHGRHGAHPFRAATASNIHWQALDVNKRARQR
jgi:bifunctional enzyme CysN/CysC